MQNDHNDSSMRYTATIPDTLHLAEVECGAAYLDEALQRDDLEILIPPRELPFDAAVNLPA